MPAHKMHIGVKKEKGMQIFMLGGSNGEDFNSKCFSIEIPHSHFREKDTENEDSEVLVPIECLEPFEVSDIKSFSTQLGRVGMSSSRHSQKN
jgi:hypothetical protein